MKSASFSTFYVGIISYYFILLLLQYLHKIVSCRWDVSLNKILAIIFIHLTKYITYIGGSPSEKITIHQNTWVASSCICLFSRKLLFVHGSATILMSHSAYLYLLLTLHHHHHPHSSGLLAHLYPCYRCSCIKRDHGHHLITNNCDMLFPKEWQMLILERPWAAWQALETSNITLISLIHFQRCSV